MNRAGRRMRMGITRRRWTIADLCLLEILYPHRSSKEIAAKLGRTTQAVTNKARILGLSKSSHRLTAAGRENVKLRVHFPSTYRKRSRIAS